MSTDAIDSLMHKINTSIEFLETSKKDIINLHRFNDLVLCDDFLQNDDILREIRDQCVCHVVTTKNLYFIEEANDYGDYV